MKNFRIGVVGAGAIAREHAISIRALPAVDHFVFFDADGERAQALALEFDGKACFSLDRLIQACDIVWVCTPPQARRDIINAACEAGRPIFCEKPLAVTREELAWTIERIKSTNTPFFMGQSNRFSDFFQKMKEVVASGEIGEVTQVWSKRIGWLDPAKTPPWRMDDNLGGGTIIELGVHELDFIRWIGGDWESVCALGSDRTLLPGQFQDTVSAIGKLKSGAMARLDISWANPRYMWRRGIEGTEGSLFFDDSDLTYIELWRPNQQPRRIPTSWPATGPGDNPSLREQARAVLDALAKGAPAPVALEDGAAAVSVALDIRDSIRLGTVVQCS